MTSNNLPDLLGKLRSEVEQLPLQSEDRTRLADIVSQIQDNLDQAPEEHASQIEHLQSSLLELEVNHPSVTGILQRITQTLSDIGI